MKPRTFLVFDRQFNTLRIDSSYDYLVLEYSAYEDVVTGGKPYVGGENLSY